MTNSKGIIHLDGSPLHGGAALSADRPTLMELAKKIGAHSPDELSAAKVDLVAEGERPRIAGTDPYDSNAVIEELLIPLRIACAVIGIGKNPDFGTDTELVKDAIEHASVIFEISALYCALAWQVLSYGESANSASPRSSRRKRAA